MRIMLLVTMLVLTGCQDNVMTDVDNRPANWADLRAKFFSECMKLASNMPRQSDDDVSDIVAECGTQSFYLANGYNK